MRAFALVALLSVLIALTAAPQYALAEESVQDALTDEIADKLDELDTSGLQEWFDSLDDDAKAALGGDFESAVNALLSGEYGGGADQFFALMLDYAVGSVTDMLAVCVTVFGIAMLFSIVSGMSSSFLKKQTVQLIGFVCYGAIAAVVLARVVAVVEDGAKTASSLTTLMNASFPVVLTLLTAAGGAASAATIGPMMGFLSGGVAAAVTEIVLPLFAAATAIGIVGNLSSSVRLDKFRSFLSSAAKTVLAAVFGLFVTLLTIKGIAGSIADSVSLKAAKFAVQSYIPLLGGYLSDGLDIVLASVVLIKNSAGAVVALMAAAAVASPVIRIVVTSLGLKLVAGLIEPFSDKRFSDMLGGIAKNLSVAAEALIALGVAFVITVMCAVVSCNAGVI